MLHAITPEDGQLAAQVVLSPWIADGVSEWEDTVLHRMTEIFSPDAAMVSSIMAQPWITDGVDMDEADGAVNLVEVLGYHPELGRFAAQQPW